MTNELKENEIRIVSRGKAEDIVKDLNGGDIEYVIETVTFRVGPSLYNRWLHAERGFEEGDFGTGREAEKKAQEENARRRKEREFLEHLMMTKLLGSVKKSAAVKRIMSEVFALCWIHKA